MVTSACFTANVRLNDVFMEETISIGDPHENDFIPKKDQQLFIKSTSFSHTIPKKKFFN